MEEALLSQEHGQDDTVMDGKYETAAEEGEEGGDSPAIMAVMTTTTTKDENDEKWRKKANKQIDTLVYALSAMAGLAVLGILWVCLSMYDDSFMIFGSFASYIGGTVVVSAIFSAYVQKKIKQKQEREAPFDNDCKDAKSRREQENGRRFLALFLVSSAILGTISMIWCSLDPTSYYFVPYPQFVAMSSVSRDRYAQPRLVPAVAESRNTRQHIGATPLRRKNGLVRES